MNLDEFLRSTLSPSFGDARTTLEAALGDSIFGEHLATRIAYAVALATDAHRLAAVLGHTLEQEERTQAEVAVAGLTMANTYAGFTESAQNMELQQARSPLSLPQYGAAISGDPVTLEMFALAISIAQRNPAQIAHYAQYLKERDFSLQQFKNLAQITSAVCAISHSGRV